MLSAVLYVAENRLFTVIHHICPVNPVVEAERKSISVDIFSLKQLLIPNQIISAP